MSTQERPSVLRQLLDKGWHYWGEVIVVGALGIFASHLVSEHSPVWLTEVTQRIYQFVSNLAPHEPSPGDITVVLIDDYDFWSGPFDRRLPLRRDYLANAVEKACSDHPAVVAIDLDLRSPLTDGTLKDNDVYQAETQTLADAISIQAAKGCSIVLPATTYCPEDPKVFCTVDSTIFSEHPLDDPHIRWGYVNLPEDLRKIPAQVHLANHGRLDSFAQAIVHAKDPERYQRYLKTEGSFSYGMFVSPHVYKDWHRQMSYADFMATSDEDLSERFKAAGIVMIGGGWHVLAVNRGTLVDQHFSPVGDISAIYLHANYVASILGGRTVHRLSKVVNILVDVVAVAIIAIVFALRFSGLRRFITIVATMLIMFVVQYLLWQNAGILFEVLIPAIALFLHWVFDEEREVRKRLAESRDAGAEAGQQLADCQAASEDIRKRLADCEAARTQMGG